MEQYKTNKSEIEKYQKEISKFQEKIDKYQRKIDKIKNNKYYQENNKKVEDKIRVERGTYFAILKKNKKLDKYTNKIQKYTNKTTKRNDKIKPIEEENTKLNNSEFKKKVNKMGYNSKKLNKYIQTTMGEYNPKIQALTNIRYGKQDIFRVYFDAPKGKHYTENDIKLATTKLSKKLNEKGIKGRFQLSILDEKFGVQSGKLISIGENAQLLEYNYEQWEVKIKAVDVFIFLEEKELEGGESKYNDCLYHALKYYVPNLEKYWSKPSKLKKFLGLERTSKINSNTHIDLIENKLNYKINITGDIIRTSLLNSNKTINIVLKNGHYTPLKTKGAKKYINVRFTEKKIIMVNRKTNSAFDGNRLWKMSNEEYNSIKYDFNSDYLIVDVDLNGGENHRYIKDNEGNYILNDNGFRVYEEISIQEIYYNWVRDANLMKQETNGLINMFKTGGYRETALDLFYKLTKFIEPEEILQDEAYWIKSCCGGIFECEKYEGTLYKYDIVACFTSILADSTKKFPIKRGEFKIIDTIKEYPEFGIYRLKIHKSDDENINKLFKFSNTGFYPQNDLYDAKKLGLKVELIQDGKPNFLHYTRDKLITFNEVFKKFTDVLFDLKVKGIKRAKVILNRLWGALCQINKTKQFIKNNEYKLDDDDEIYSFRCDLFNRENFIIETTKFNSFYQTNYARLYPFIHSFARSKIIGFMLPHKNNIKRIQLDGFLTTKPIHFNRDAKLGMLNYEGKTENGKIIHKNNYVNVK